MNWLIVSALAEETAEAAEKTPTYLEKMFEKLGEVTATSWISIAALVILGVILIAISMTQRKWTAKMIASGALAISLSFILSCIRLFKMPSHGSVTPGSMLPIMLFAISYGIGPGLLAGLAYGILQYIQDPSFLSVWQFLFDYLLAFAALGLAGIAHGKSDKWMYISIPIAALCRAVFAILAGLMWVAEYGMSELMGITFNSPLLYSAVYNGLYLVPDTVICLLLARLSGKRLVKIMRSK